MNGKSMIRNIEMSGLTIWMRLHKKGKMLLKSGEKMLQEESGLKFMTISWLLDGMLI